MSRNRGVTSDDKERLAITSSVNSKVYPALAVDVRGYRSSDDSKALMLVRVPRSDAAPHEYTGRDQAINFPIRRATGTDRLSLAEMEVLALRRTAASNESPLGQRSFGRVSIQPINDRDGYVGIGISPLVYSHKRRVMDIKDDRMCFTISEVTRGERDVIHGELELHSFADSNWLHTKGWKPHQGAHMSTGYGPDYLGPKDAMEIFSDGTIVARLSQTDEDPFKQVVYALLMGYTAAQEVFYNFALIPEARCHIITRFDDRRGKFPSPLPDAYEDWFDVNLAAETFADAFVMTIMRLLRSGDHASDRETMRSILDEFSLKVLPAGDELRSRWGI